MVNYAYEGEYLVLAMEEEGKGWNSKYLTDDFNKAIKMKRQINEENDYVSVIITEVKKFNS